MQEHSQGGGGGAGGSERVLGTRFVHCTVARATPPGAPALSCSGFLGSLSAGSEPNREGRRGSDSELEHGNRADLHFVFAMFAMASCS